MLWSFYFIFTLLFIFYVLLYFILLLFLFFMFFILTLFLLFIFSSHSSHLHVSEVQNLGIILMRVVVQQKRGDGHSGPSWPYTAQHVPEALSSTPHRKRASVA